MLQLGDDAGASMVIPLLDDASDRQRITLLRSLMIAGCVLHELDYRFPRLLASMPEPPASLEALRQLAVGLLKEKGINMPEVTQTASAQHREVNNIVTEPHLSIASHVRI